MPGGDRTGPRGMGPATGRAAGYCADYSVPGYMNPGPGRGFGRGWGQGMGWGRGGRGFGRGMGRGPRWAYPYEEAPFSYYPPELSAKDEAGMLKNQAEALKQALDNIQNRISVLEKGKSEKAE